MSVFWAFLGLLIGPAQGYPSDSPVVFTIQLDDATINPVTAEYILKTIAQAEEQNAQALIIELDTPGGLLSSTRTIVKGILAAEVPVVVYIYPSGSRAGSAGVFITYASHIAAMAQSTNIGAAHPVEFGQERGPRKDKDDDLKELRKLIQDLKEKRGKPSKESQEPKESRESQNAPKTLESKKKSPKQSSLQKQEEKKEDALKEESPAESPETPESESEEDPLSAKILNDTVAFIRALAQLRHRNVEWAVESVTKSSSITETEALEKGVIEIVAKDQKDLLEKLDGRTVEIKGQSVRLQTKDAVVKRIDMDFRQSFLNILANPNIAYLFLMLGFYGLLYEITHPGFGIPGVVGIVLLILAFFSMQMLPTNYAGVALIILAISLFIAEAKVAGVGFLAAGGVVSMILGSLLLFDSSLPAMRVSFSLIMGLTAATAGITIFLVRAVILTHKRKVLGGQEGLVGEEGRAVSEITSKKEGKVFVHGELWNAYADEPVRKDEKIRVLEVQGMLLKVRRI